MLVLASPEDKVISLVQRLDQEGVSVTLYDSDILQPIFKQPSNVYWLSFGLVFRDQVSMHKLGRTSAGIHSTSRTGMQCFLPGMATLCISAFFRYTWEVLMVYVL